LANQPKPNFKNAAKSSGYGQNKTAAAGIKEAALKRANENKNVKNMSSL
jgi:hypothetical protein